MRTITVEGKPSAEQRLLSTLRARRLARATLLVLEQNALARRAERPRIAWTPAVLHFVRREMTTTISALDGHGLDYGTSVLRTTS
jgi:hypothetical protein